MKRPTFTEDPNVQDELAYKERKVVPSEEWTLTRVKGSAWVSSQNKFRSRQDFLQYAEQHDNPKLALGRYLGSYFKALSVKSVLGLGSGECYPEYAIKSVYPEITIAATDFDPFVVEKVSEFLPEIDKVEVLDIKKDDFARFQGKYDAVLMVSVDYVLSDEEMVDLFRRLPVVGANHIIMISASYLHLRRVLTEILISPLRLLKNLLPQKTKRQRRFHGWSRSRGEFIRLMKMAGTVRLHKIVTEEPLSKAHPLIHIVPSGKASGTNPRGDR